jgi:hypothetical protein
MIEYKGQLNMGNEALGTEKTITANEVLRTCDTKALAREINHQNKLIPEDVAAAVLGYFCKAAVEKMAEGFAIQLYNGQDVALRIFPDIHVKGGNINLARAKELDPTVTELTAENAGDLIDKAGGVTCRVRATCMQKFTDLLEKEEYQVKRVGIETKAYVERVNGDDTGDDNGGGDNQGGEGGGDNNGGGSEGGNGGLE